MDHTPPPPHSAAVAVSVAPFDDSAADFFSAMDGISALCSSEEERFDAGEIERFGSMITFLREWRDFRYEPKTVKFVYETEPGEAREAAKGVNLPQFSSAAVPKIEKLHGEPMSGSDFVFYAGGPVWALDWCPRSAESFSSDVKCEYLAVSAHPPGSEYHRIGQPLKGRGVIQIWCLVNNSIAENFVPGSMVLKTRWRPRKRPLQDDPEDGTYTPGIPVKPKRPRGRPRKQPRQDDSEDETYTPGITVKPKRPRGRPRKQPLPGSTNLSGQEESAVPTDSPVTIVNESIQPLSVNLADVTLSLSAAAVGVDDSKDETYTPGITVKPKRPRGRPRKQPLTCSTNLSGQEESAVPTDSPVTTINESIRPLSVDLADVTLSLPAPAGVDKASVPRSEKKPNQIINDGSPEFDVELGLNADLNELALAFSASVDLSKEESLFRRDIGRPRLNPTNINEFDPASDIELGKDASLSSLRGENFGQLSFSVDPEIPGDLIASVDLNIKEKPVVLKRRGRSKKKINVTTEVPTSGIESGKEAPLSTSREEDPGQQCLNIDMDDVPVASLASVDVIAKEKRLVLKCRGRPKKKTKLNVSVLASGIKSGKDASLPTSRGEDLGLECLDVNLVDVRLATVASANEIVKEKPLLLKHSGSPKKKPNENESVPASGVGSGEDESLPTSRGEDLGQECLKVNLVDVSQAILVSNNEEVKEKPLLLKHGARPKKKTNVNVSVLASGIESGKDASLPTSRGEDLEQDCLNVNLVDVPLAFLASANEKVKEKPLSLKHRGRPKKKTNLDVSIPASGTESGKGALLFTSRGEHLGHHCLDVNLDDVPLATLVSSNGKVKKKPVAIKHRGKPKKKTDVNSGIPVSGIESRSDALLPTSRGEDLGQHCLDVDLDDVPLAFLASADQKVKEKLVKRRGRASKDPILTVNNGGVELGEEASAQLPPSGGIENFSLKFSSTNSQGIPLALPAFTDLSGKGELLAPRCRGRPGRKPVHDSDEFKISAVELREDALATPSPTCPKNSSTNSLSTNLAEAALPASAELNNKENKSLPRNRERQGNDPIPNINNFVQAYGVELGVDESSVPSQAKQQVVTVKPSHVNHIQDRITPCEEILPNRLTNTNTTRSISTQSIALPRVVLCLAHDGKVAWDVKWRPLNAKSSEGQRHMGYLAVLLGNGSLQVWEVPLPSMVKSLYGSCCREGTDPRFMRLKPVFGCSMVKRGDRQSIPLTVEWSPSGPCDFIVAGCHDGTVALWRFSTEYSYQDTKPLLCFTADTGPIRALAWAPEVSDLDNANLIVTAGHEGLKFWDLRDPYRPLWEFNPVNRIILSLDWLKDPRCIMLSYDDGTLRTISLSKAASDVPVTGISATGTKPPGLHTHQSSSFTIWSVHISRVTGLVAYCGADGTTIHFQLTTKFIEKDASRNRQPHFLCGSLGEEGQTLIISTPLPNNPCSDIPSSTKKSLSGYGDTPLTVSSNRTGAKEAQQVNSQFPALYSGDLSIVLGHGDPHTPLARKSIPICNMTKKPKSDTSQLAGKAPLHGEANPRTTQCKENQDGDQERKVAVVPAKIVAMHRVRWNMNKGSERWLCYGGAAGIVRCQVIGLPTLS